MSCLVRNTNSGCFTESLSHCFEVWSYCFCNWNILFVMPTHQRECQFLQTNAIKMLKLLATQKLYLKFNGNFKLSLSMGRFAPVRPGLVWPGLVSPRAIGCRSRAGPIFFWTRLIQPRSNPDQVRRLTGSTRFYYYLKKKIWIWSFGPNGYMAVWSLKRLFGPFF